MDNPEVDAAVAERLAEAAAVAGLAESDAKSSEFWQRLLAAELSPLKCSNLLRALDRAPDPVRALLASPILSANERQRAESVRVDLLPGLFSKGAGLLHREHYPDCFKAAQSAPPALFYWGDPGCLASPTVAIVGTRGASTYGKAVAQKFAEGLARSGVTVVSGGALGIDAAAHKGALAAGGKTVAVLLSGIERVYPRVHYQLFEQVKKNGCLISQFAVGTVSSREYRPLMRNGIIAGLSSAVIVIEAPECSGAISTAGAANDLGRQVFVVPANIDNIGFRGSHSLIRDGATLVDHPDQVLDALGIAPGLPFEEAFTAATGAQKDILSVLSTDPLAPEFIVERTGLETSEVMSELTILELEGRIIRDVGGYALRV